MKINYTTNDNNIITSYTITPFDVTLPFIELDDASDIKIGVDSIIDGKLEKGIETKSNNFFARILVLKKKLAETDYKVLKYIEGELSEDDFIELKAQRKAWRDEIDSLEKSAE